jgi:hypothetical protein
VSAHPQIQLVPPDSDEPVGIDVEMVPLIQALWLAGYRTITCCQDLGESVTISPRHAAYWRGRALLELPAADALALAELAAAHGFPMHWADPDAWEMSVPVLMLGARALVMDNMVQLKFPAGQLRHLTALVGRRGAQFREGR